MLFKQDSPRKIFVTKLMRLLFVLIFGLIALVMGFNLRPHDSNNTVLTGNTSKFVHMRTFIQTAFGQAKWYPLIANVQTEEKNLVIQTSIYPDDEGKQLADEIIKELRGQGVNGPIQIYGRNVTYRLLCESSQ